jgi:predicted amidophosphoribosyltransferase
MKFVFKIWSNYDGFTPRAIPKRMSADKRLALGWRDYIDEVEPGDEIWVYFHGKGVQPSGVYIMGIVEEIEASHYRVIIRVFACDVVQPLTDSKVSAHIAAMVAAHGRQVFLLPDDWDAVPHCSALGTADTCAKRQCVKCKFWNSLPRIDPANCRRPPRLSSHCAKIVSAYWTRSRQGVYGRDDMSTGVRQGAQLWKSFKVGTRNLTFPLALAMYHSLKEAKPPDFDCIVPVPLSPDKKKMFHRTLALATELGKLLNVPVWEDALTLSTPISKRELRLCGYTWGQIEAKYVAALELSEKLQAPKNLLLVDDVSTHGTTLGCIVRRIRQVNSKCVIWAATAGQMMLRAVIKDDRTLLAE